MRIFIICLLFACFASVNAVAQKYPPAPQIQWQQSFGGSGSDLLRSFEMTDDGGYLLGGTSDSGSTGGKTNTNFGTNDYWIVRTTSRGVKMWEKEYGGTGEDLLSSVVAAGDGGFLLAGSSSSGVGGNKTNGTFGGFDYWIVRIDSTGTKLWERNFGGASDDLLQVARKTSDGGFILGGWSFSNTNGNKTAPLLGGQDYWVVRVDAAGNKLWDKSFSGAGSFFGRGSDLLYSLEQTSDGGFILGGASNSGSNSNKTSTTYGGLDYWIVRLDANGTKLWDNSFGGSGDDVLTAVKQTRDGGFILGGYSASGISGTKTNASFGTNDFYVVRVDTNGIKQWEQVYGGSGDDRLSSLFEMVDGGYLFAGTSASGTDGNRTAPTFGGNDWWVVRTDSTGNKLWELSFGGAQSDTLAQISQSPDGGFTLGGTSLSGISGNKNTLPNGLADYWIVRLGAEPPVARVTYQNADMISQSGFTWFLSGETNRSYVFEYSTDFSAWQPFATNVMNAPEIPVNDGSAGSAPFRFYRARRLP